MANKIIEPNIITPTHAMLTIQNAHLELIYRECIRENQI